VVRMANLSIISCHTVNGVSELHTRILKERLFKEFEEFFPGKFINITNGVSPRRWLIQINPELSELISSVIGDGWWCDLAQLKSLKPFSEDKSFVGSWQAVKRHNKKHLARYILRRVGLKVNPETLFDVQVKRLHEYKRQLLKVLHVVTLYNRIKANADVEMTPRTVIFAGKAAPGYFMAKLIIKLINSVAETVNNDSLTAGCLQVVFLPNYCVSQAEKIIPAADLSEQISTAGMEASGTGNMKFALNGALTIGTMDGANIEILQEVGEENIFIFGLKADEVAALRGGGYNPRDIYEKDIELKSAIDLIASGAFSKGDTQLFAPIIDSLLNKGDYYCVLADYRSYMEAQDQVARLYRQPDEWARRAILNTASMGKFSSDRAVAEYAQKVWNVKPVEI
jgi:glycogen phosphorylase